MLDRLCGWGAEDALDPLTAIANDPDLPPQARAEAAWSLAGYGPEHRDPAAAVGRRLMLDTSLPPSVRIRAARLVALVSDLLRDEAHQFLRSTSL